MSKKHCEKGHHIHQCHKKHDKGHGNKQLHKFVHDLTMLKLSHLDNIAQMDEKQIYEAYSHSYDIFKKEIIAAHMPPETPETI